MLPELPGPMTHLVEDAWSTKIKTYLESRYPCALTAAERVCP